MRGSGKYTLFPQACLRQDRNIIHVLGRCRYPITFQASDKIDLEATYAKIKADGGVTSVNYFGGGRGRHDNDCGNLCFQFARLPGAKFQVSPNGTVQVHFPDPALIDYLPADLDTKLWECLVSVKGEAVPLIEVEDTCVVSEPLPAFYARQEPGYLGKLHLSERERQIDFYTLMLLDLEDDVGFVKRILEVLHSEKKGVALDGLPKFGARLRHKGDMLFLGEWTEEEKK